MCHRTVTVGPAGRPHIGLPTPPHPLTRPAFLAVLLVVVTAGSPVPVAQGAWSVPASQGQPVPADLDAAAGRVFVDWTALPPSAWSTLTPTAFAYADVRAVADAVGAQVGLPVAVADDVPAFALTVEVAAEPAVYALARLAAQADLALYHTAGTLVLAPVGWSPAPTAVESASGPEAAPAPVPTDAAPTERVALSLDLAGDDVAAVADDVAGRYGWPSGYVHSVIVGTRNWLTFPFRDRPANVTSSTYLEGAP